MGEKEIERGGEQVSARESVDGFRMNESCSEETDSTLFPQRRKEGQTNFSYGLILAQVLQ